MQPAAVLKVLVQADGVSRAARQIRGFDSDLDKVGSRSGRTTGKFAALGAMAGKAAKVGIGALAAGAPLAGAKLVSLASDAEETASKFRTVFGRETDRAIKRLDAFSKATGTSKFALREQAAQFQALIRPMGLTTKASAGMSIGMTKLATDLASFNNTSVDEAITALQSGLVGEAEPLRRFGVQLSAARVEAFAYAEGIAKQGAELTSAQKAQASYGIILKDTELAQGDAVRTAGSFANQWKRLKNQATDLATELGMKLLPIVTKVITAITGFISGLQDGEGATSGFGATVSRVFNVARSVVIGAVGAIRGWIRGHRDDIDAAAQAVQNIGRVIQFVWEEWALPVIKRILPAIKQIVEGNFRIIGGIIDVIAGILTGDFGRAWDGVKAIFSGAIKATLGMMRGLTASIRELLSRLGSLMRSAWEGIRSAASSYWQAIRTVIINPARTAVGAVRDAVGGLVGWLGDRWASIRETASNAWQRVKELIVNPVASARDRVVDVIGNLVDRVRGGWSRILDGARDFAGNVKDAIVNAFENAANKVVDFVNAIIGVVNKIPGVDIGKVKGFASGGVIGRDEKAQALAQGGKVTMPMAIVGEEAPTHPEYVIPTNPAYRGRALGLYAALGRELNVPGYALGGVLGKASGIVDTVKDVAGAGLGLLTKGASAITDLLPSPGDYLPGWLGGLGSHVIDSVSGWIKDKVKSVLSSLGGGGGGGYRSGTWALANHLASKFGLSISSSYRDPQHNAAVGGVPGSSHTKGSPANPGAHDFVPPSVAAMHYAINTLGAMWADIHDFGSGLHLHVSWFKKGGVLDQMSAGPFVGSFHGGGVASQEGLAHVAKGEQIGGPLIRIDHMEVHDRFDEQKLAADLAWRLQTA